VAAIEEVVRSGMRATGAEKGDCRCEPPPPRIPPPPPLPTVPHTRPPTIPLHPYFCLFPFLVARTAPSQSRGVHPRAVANARFRRDSCCVQNAFGTTLPRFMKPPEDPASAQAALLRA